jgi:hypothetical protein
MGILTRHPVLPWRLEKLTGTHARYAPNSTFVAAPIEKVT